MVSTRTSRWRWNTLPFINDVPPFVRGFMVIYLLVMTDNPIEPMMVIVLKYLKASGIVADGEKECFSNAAK